MNRGGRSAASRVFLALVTAVVVVSALTGGLLLWEGQRATRAEAERVTAAVAHTLADSPAVRAALAGGDPATATRDLQPLAQEVIADAGVDFVTVMTPAGIRITHRTPTEIGRPYLGTIPETPVVLTEQFTGALGPSLRTIVPVTDGDAVLGWVSVGVTVETVSLAVLPRVLAALGIGLAVAVAGLASALLARRATRRVAGDLPAGAIRDTLASAESMRTLGEALRAQTHEHGNRMHTAAALLELGRTEEALGILTDSARQSQALVDQVSAEADGDPMIGALLLGKASQARERGVAWEAEIAPDAPRSPLTPIDSVAVVGNLVDNALDAASAGPEPRWVRVRLLPTADGELAVVVSDSGTGVPASLRPRIFDRGFSTKPAGIEGRGVGLALVRSIVDDAGGSIVLDPHPPTTFRLVLPPEES